MELLVTAIVIALLVYGLERNRRRHPSLTGNLAGSTDIVDRDAERVSRELLRP